MKSWALAFLGGLLFFFASEAGAFGIVPVLWSICGGFVVMLMLGIGLSITRRLTKGSQIVFDRMTPGKRLANSLLLVWVGGVASIIFGSVVQSPIWTIVGGVALVFGTPFFVSMYRREKKAKKTPESIEEE